jgi:hypothetical protein
MVIGKGMAAASISDGRLARLAAALTLAATLAMSPPGHAAEEVFVQQDNTPIASRPGVGGKILIRVDTGFVLTVLSRDGDWLEVSSPVLKLPGDSLWVPAERVGSEAPGGGALDGLVIARGPDYRLEVTGSPELRMRARCRIDEGLEERRDDALRTIIEDVPAVVELTGPVDCFVRMFGPPGEMNVILRRIDGTVVASGTTFATSEAVHVRSDGPWGSAGGVIESSAFASFDRPGNIVPPLTNPVPPLANPVPPLTNPVPPLVSLVPPQ